MEVPLPERPSKIGELLPDEPGDSRFEVPDDPGNPLGKSAAQKQNEMQMVRHDHPSIKLDPRPTIGNGEELSSTDVADQRKHHDPRNACAEVSLASIEAHRQEEHAGPNVGVPGKAQQMTAGASHETSLHRQLKSPSP